MIRHVKSAFSAMKLLEPYRLKIKVGPHEFEAEGDSQVVHEQFQAFKELIASMPSIEPPQTHNEPPSSPPAAQAPPPNRDMPPVDELIDHITRLDNRIVSMTVRPTSAENGVLLILYGQKLLRSNDSVTGGEVMDGLTATGGLSVQRADRLLEKLARDGDVIVFGERRSKRYRLTNSGLNKAREIAREMIATVA